MAMSVKTTPSTAPIQNSGFRFSDFQASLQRLFCRSLVTSSVGAASPVVVPAWTSSWIRSCCWSVITDPRVEDGVQHVDDQVEEDEEDHQRDDADHDRALLLAHGVVDLTPHPGQVEHRLGDDGAAQQRADVGAD